MKNSEKFRIYKELQDKGLLDFGTVIYSDTLLRLFGMDNIESMEFLFTHLTFMTFLKDEGILCTSENVPRGCIKIYDADEVADEVERIVQKSFKKMSRAQKCMYKTDMSELSYTDMKKHMHQANKIQSILYGIRDKLKELE